MNKFNLRDTVKIMAHEDDPGNGKTGVIVDLEGDHYQVEFDANGALWYWSNQLKGAFKPATGDVYARARNDRLRVLVICGEQEIADNGWIVYGVIIYRDGSYSAPRLLSVYAKDRKLCEGFPLPEAAALALTRRNQIIEKSARGESLNDDDHHNMTLCGMAVTFPKLAARGLPNDGKPQRSQTQS